LRRRRAFRARSCTDCARCESSATLLRMLGDYDDARFKELAMRFSSPVYPGEMIEVEIWKDGSFRAPVAARGVVVVNNGYAAFAAPAHG